MGDRAAQWPIVSGRDMLRILPHCPASFAMRLRALAALLVVLSAGLLKAEGEPPANGKVDFVADVQPILIQHCAGCHGSEKQQAGLRLDRKADALAGGDSGRVIEAGRSAKSLLIELVSGTDPERVMPPKGDRLTAQQVAVLRAWIDQGANWPETADLAGAKSIDHWSFKRLERPNLPKVRNAGWVRTPIDRFVLAKLEAQGLTPSPEADRPTLIRRLSLDLLGLPPTREEVADFENDPSPHAYEQLVERLLASPRFGERWGRHWLDLARYADSDGYEKDNVRPFAYRYRDWVIEAINRDLPYDQFTREQLAGDLLPNATLEQKLATGFHRNTLTNTEGGVDQEEFRVAATVDRVNTTSAIWLGLTVGCAQCHSHKYDPITQREYYELFAFFNSIDERNIPAPHTAEAEAHAKAQQTFDAEHAPLVAAQAADEKANLPARLAAWEPTFKDQAVDWTPLSFTSMKSTAGAELKALEDQSLLVTGTNPETDTYLLEATTPLSEITAIRIETLRDEGLGGFGPGRTPHGNYVLSEVRLQAAPRNGAELKDVSFSQATADFEQFHNGQPFFTAKAAIDGKSDTGWAVADKFGVSHTLVLETKENVGFEGGSKLTLTLDQQHGTQHTIGRFRVSVTAAPRPVTVSSVPDGLVAILNTPPDNRTDAQKATLITFFKTVDPESIRLKKAIDEHLKKAPKPPATQAQTVVERTEPRPTHIHIRGDFLRKGDAVPVGTLDVLHPATLPEKATRVDLANWLMDPSNPLTPRVTANQWWQWLMGKPLVATVDDFGVKGEPPSHPKLLDWLAVELLQPSWRPEETRDAGLPWSRKRMIRLIVSSATYRQTSTIRPELNEVDPKNTWLGRQNRFRLEAEVVRDVNLAVSGLLENRVGGPSVRPPLPAGVAELGYAGSVKWPESSGPDRYRRGMYIFFQRTVPYPMLIAFDTPDSNNACVRRERSNTPLQALTLLNDPVFYECARAFGSRIASLPPGNGEDRLAAAFQMCVSRRPTPAERARLQQLHERLQEIARSDPAQAAKAVGRTDASDPQTLDLAAATGLARVLLNLDEFLTRE